MRTRSNIIVVTSRCGPPRRQTPLITLLPPRTDARMISGLARLWRILSKFGPDSARVKVSLVECRRALAHNGTKLSRAGPKEPVGFKPIRTRLGVGPGIRLSREDPELVRSRFRIDSGSTWGPSHLGPKRGRIEIDFGSRRSMPVV